MDKIEVTFTQENNESLTDQNEELSQKLSSLSDQYFGDEKTHTTTYLLNTFKRARRNAAREQQIQQLADCANNQTSFNEKIRRLCK